MAAKTYFTGKSCKRGHIAERYSSNSCCVPCVKAESKRRAKEHPERRKELHAAWRKRNPEKLRKWGAEFRRKNPEVCRAYVAAWEKRNAGKVSAYRAQYRKKNPAKMRALFESFREANPGYFTIASERRRSRELQAPGAGVSLDQWRGVLVESLGVCAYCNEKRRLTMDHIDPISAGGEHDVQNVVAACRRCNSSKNDTPLLLWLTKRHIRSRRHSRRAA